MINKKARDYPRCNAAVAGSKPGRCRGQRNKYNQSYIEFREVMILIVETQKNGSCTCHYDDSSYKDKTKEEIEHIIENFSAFVLKCLQKKKTA